MGVADHTDIAGVTDVADITDVTDITDVAGVTDITPVKASASQLGDRRDRTDMAGWLATSKLNNGTDCLPTVHLALGTGICGNDLCKLRCLISRIPAGPFKRG